LSLLLNRPLHRLLGDIEQNGLHSRVEKRCLARQMKNLDQDIKLPMIPFIGIRRTDAEHRS
jgi:hypothetical protein